MPPQPSGMMEGPVGDRSPRLNRAIGPSVGPPLLLLHGVARRWQDFAPILPELALRWEVHALDLRGHGRSERAIDGYLAVDYARDVLDYLNREVGEPAVLVGHSLGAMVAVAAAARAPAFVRAVVLEDPPFEMMGDRIHETFYGDLFAAYRELAGPDRSVDEVAAGLAEVRIMPPGLRRPVRLGDLRDPTSLRFSASCLQRLDPAVLTPVIEGRWLRGFPTGDWLAATRCPALYLEADFAAGGAVPEEYGRAIAARLKRGSHIRLVGAGHLIHWTHREAMVRCVLGFLESLD